MNQITERNVWGLYHNNGSGSPQDGVTAYLKANVACWDRNIYEYSANPYNLNHISILDMMQKLEEQLFSTNYPLEFKGLDAIVFDSLTYEKR